MEKKLGMMFLGFILGLLLAAIAANATTVTSEHKIPMGEFKLTAYCPCEECSEGYGVETATKKTARSEHTVAVDPDVIAYGTKILIGNTVYVAEDCGVDVKGEHIDIFFDTHEEVEDFEVKYKDIWLLRGDYEE